MMIWRLLFLFFHLTQIQGFFKKKKSGRVIEMKKKLTVIGSIFLMGACLSTSAFAGTVLRGAFQDAALSIDGWGGDTNTVGYLQTDLPTGATVLKAYLYSADVYGGGAAGDVTLEGQFYSTASGILLPKVAGNPVNVRLYDVTSYMKSKIEAAGAGVKNWSITEGGYSDGEVLVVAYQAASTLGGTAIIMDGGLAQGGDTTKLNFSTAYAGGDAILSLASSFSYGDSQNTTVDITTSSTASRRLTSAAGSNDDSNFIGGNGGLITVGGVGDNPANPADPQLTGGHYDDELYNLALGNTANADPFLKIGDTSLELKTNNPSFDDNVFAMFFTSSFKISDVNDEDIDNKVPEPATMLLFGTGIAGLAAVGRRKRS